MIVKINNIVIVIVLLSAITLPLVFSDKAGGRMSETENRYLATFPAILTKDMNSCPRIYARVGKLDTGQCRRAGFGFADL